MLKQRKIAFKKIFIITKKTFPFLSIREFEIFHKAFKKYSRNLDNLPTDDRGFFLFVEQFLASLNNSHTKLGSYPGKRFFRPRKYSAVLMGKNFYLRGSAGNLLGEILSIDDKRPLDVLNFHISRISGSTKQYSNYRALMFLLTSHEEVPIVLKIKKMNGEIKSICLAREVIVYKPFKKIVETEIIDKNIGYLKIKAWSGGDDTKKILDKKINYFIKNKIRSLIIDLRGNEGGNSSIAKHLAGHFFDKKVVFSIIKERISKSDFKLKKRLAYVESSQPYVDLPIILLIDESCLSSNEYFIAGMKDNKRAYLIGKTTGGGSGNPKKFVIPYGDKSFELLVSTWMYFRPNGQQLEGNGIKPNLFMKESVQDFGGKRDKVLATALEKGRLFIRQH